MSDALYVGETVQLYVSGVTHEVTGSVDEAGEALTLTATVTPPSGAAPAVSAATRLGAAIWVTFVPLVAGVHLISFGGAAAGGEYRGRLAFDVGGWP